MIFCDSSYGSPGEAVVNYLKAVGIQLKLRPLEDLKLKGK